MSRASTSSARACIMGTAVRARTRRRHEFDLSRCVRSNRWKLIYNLTPQMEYWPVDSGGDPGWQQMVAAHKAGTAEARSIERAYFPRPRPVLELYDLDADPGELHNLAGQAEVRDIQQTLMAVMQEKIITDYDFVPPVLNEAQPLPTKPAKNTPHP